jgi:hypothetical protein
VNSFSSDQELTHLSRLLSFASQSVRPDSWGFGELKASRLRSALELVVTPTTTLELSRSLVVGCNDIFLLDFLFPFRLVAMTFLYFKNLQATM